MLSPSSQLCTNSDVNPSTENAGKAPGSYAPTSGLWKDPDTVQAGGRGQGGGREGGPWTTLVCEGGSLPLRVGGAGVCLLP